jgi:hypothetical protein
VVYPGARHRAHGPDFQGALLLAADGQLHQGDVEVHVRPSEWHAHGHHLDPAYDRVILHVVWEPSTGTRPLRASGSPVPELALAASMGESAGRLREAFTRAQSSEAEPPAWSPEAAVGLLETAGLARFSARAGECQADIAALGPGQTLYRRLAQALGYAANQRAFLRLADQVPLQELTDRVRHEGVDSASQYLLAWAGLAGDPVPDGLRPSDWVLAGVRPSNHPARRVLALPPLVARGGADLARMLSDAVRRAAQTGRPAILLDALIVPTQAAQPASLRHSISPTPRAPVSPCPLLDCTASPLGTGRAAEAAVSALLPWAFAWGELAEDEGLRRAALNCYRAFPRGADNAISRETVRLLGLPSGVARSACQQQGLLHLYRTQLHDMAAWEQTGDGAWHWRPRVAAPRPARETQRKAVAAG